MALRRDEADWEARHRLRDIETRRSILAFLGDRGHPLWRQSWAEVAERYTPALRCYVGVQLDKRGCVTGDRYQDAHDIVQDYLLAAMKKGWLGSPCVPIAKFRAYVTTQLKRFTCTWLRDGRARKRGGEARYVHDGLERLTAREPDPADQAFEKSCMELAIRRALEAVERQSPKHAEVIRLLMRAPDKRLAISDIAEAFGISRNAAYTRKHRALHVFSRSLAQELCDVVRDEDDLHAEWARLRVYIPWLPKDAPPDDDGGAGAP